MVVAPGQHTGTALLYDGLAHARTQHNLGCGSVSTSATSAAGWYVNAGYLRATFVLQAQGHSTLVLAQFRVHVKDGTGFYLADLRGNRAVLYRVRARGIEAGVNFHLVYRQGDVALGIGVHSLTVQRHALDRATTAKIVPAAGTLPTVQVGTDKLLRHPFALAYLEGYTGTLHALLFLHRCNGGGKGVVAFL